MLIAFEHLYDESTCTVYINPEFVVSLFWVEKGNSVHPTLLNNEYTAVHMARGLSYCIGRPIVEVAAILKGT